MSKKSDSLYSVFTIGLMRASLSGDLDKVKTLIENGADVNAKNENGWDVLMSASMNGHNEVVKILIENGANVNAKDENGWTALMRASMNNHNEVVKTLLENKADINAKKDEYTALMIASIRGNNNVVKTLLENKADLDFKDKYGDTALTLASREGYNDIIKTLLIDYKIKVSEEDKSKLKKRGYTYTLDLIAKRDFEKTIQQEIRQIPETPIKKQSKSFKL